MVEIEKKLQQLAEAIARKIRELRMAMGWTLDRMSETTGLSKSYLSQIENGDKMPTIATLTKIAYAFRVNVQDLMGEEPSPKEDNSLTIVRAGERRPIMHTVTGEGYHYESLTYKRVDRLMDGYMITTGFDLPSEPFKHEGQELHLLLEGAVEFIYDGRSHIINTGDCVYFDSDRPHMSCSLGDKKAKIMVVFCNPSRQ